MPNVIMLLSNAFRPDPRVLKEANSLAEAGYNIYLICWDRKGEFPEVETLPSGATIIRIQNVRTIYGAGVRQILYTPRFWNAAIKKAIDLRPDLIHCHDLDTLYAGVRIKKKVGGKLIFDAHEDYPSLMSLYLPGIFIAMLNWFEHRMLHYVDAVIAASSLFVNKLTTIGFSPIIYLPNVQDLNALKQVTQEQVNNARQDLGLQSDDYVIGYIGVFSRNRLLLPLIEASRDLPYVTLLLWGDGHQRQAVEHAISGIKNIHYLGWLSPDKVLLYTIVCDVVYYCLMPDYPGAKYNAPNTLSNAMAAGRPIIANDLGDLGRIIRENECGIIINDVTPDTIKRAIGELKDTVLRNKLGAAGYLAAQREYNWQVAEERLLMLYKSMFSSSSL
jgi:glycosyltransferase involved in cell wall biosynthesis